jgi:PST family polysaccharide transporter
VIGQAIFPVWFFQGIEKMKYITVINVGAKIIFTVLIFIFVNQPKDFILVPIFNSTGFIIAGVLSLVISLKSVTWQWPAFKGSRAFYVESFHMFVSGFSSSLVTSLNVFLLGIFGGDFLVGIYSSFEKLILAAKNMFFPIYQALYPYMSRQSPKRVHSLMKKIAPGVFLLGLGIIAIFYFLSDFILGSLYDDLVILEYSYLFKIMSMIALFSGLQMLYSVLYAPATKQFKKLMWITIGCGLFNLLLSLYIVPKFYMEGTVAAVVITEFVLMVLCMFFYWKDLKTFRFTVSNR